ncbi:amino acid adenylation domain-containing protein/non-ribosomal peptide synthase protein (TIGR01720 family) [Paenibacillus mucilaginosus]|uniref:amino acid adenylation domain-containing protein n=1 Tax=Paenibacillus mucilaginosus TaxID=61624 RepID=UPI003D1A8687
MSTSTHLRGSLTEIMLENGKTTGKGIGFISGKNRETFMSYSELCRRSLRILHVLQKRGVEPGQEIVFQLENNEHFISLFWACLFGGMIPVPVTVGHNDEHKRKLFGIWRVLNHPFLVAEPESIVHLQKFAFANGLDGDLQRMMKESEFYDTLAMGSTPGIIHPSRVEDMAFIQFSSGSTGSPKGVIITHANALANTRAINQGYGTTVNDSVLSWVPLTHDMGLAAIHLTAAEAGIDQYIMPPDLFVRNPMLWLDKAHEHRITFLSSPNFGYRHFLNHYHPEEERPWDLSSVRLILNGAEPISRTLCQEFHETLVPYGLNPNATLPAYGMAEATVVVSLGRLGEELASSTVDRTALQVASRVEELPADAPGSLTLVDVGLPIEDCEFRICDDKDQVLDDRMLGHVQIRGRNVSSGYYNNPEATAAVLTPDGWLRTGDLGFIRDGRLVMAGRAKDVIFVNGQNIYPHDLEQIAGGLEGLDPGKVAACGIPDPTGERENIVFFAVFRKGVRAFAPLAEQIKRRVFHETGLEADAVLPIRHIPKTTSGKPQRYKLAARYESGEFAETVRLLEDLKTELSPDGGDRTPREGLERQLSELWSAVLGTGPIGLHDHLIEFGAHSLTLLRLMDAMEKELKRRIRLSELVSHPTVHTFAEYLRQDKAGSSAVAYSDFSVQAGQGRNEPFPLTEVQTAYWLGRRPEYELGGISSHYYMEIETKLSLPRLEEALQQLIRMHPMLRMIVTVDGEQQILPEVPYYPIPAEDIRRLTPEEQISRIEERRECMSHRVFVPGRWPLFEVEAVKVSEDTHHLFIGFDLLMADGYSLRLFARDWLACFEHPGKRFPECSFTFRDYITAYLRMREAPMYQEDRSYWLKRLDSLPPSPALPLTAPVLSVAKPRFKRLQAEVPELAWEALRRRCAAIRVTPSALLCTAYAEVLSYWSNQSRFTLNVTAFNRYPFHDEVNRVIGDFTSLMLVDVELGEGETFKQRTGRMQERMMEVLQHRHFDGVEVIRELAKARQAGNSAIMPVVFTSLLFDDNDDEWSRIGTTQWAISQTSQVYLDHQVMESGGKLNVNWDYVEDLFEPEVIEGMFRQYMELLLTLAETWETAKLQPPAQDLELISRFNRTEEAILPATLHGLFEQQAMRTPDAPAIVLGGPAETVGCGYTYRELQQRSARIARYLRGQGIGRGDTVAVLAERRPETAANVLGVLKAGAAYVPVDPQYPVERRQYILENAGCRLLLEEDLYELERLAACELADDASGEERPEARPEDLAYIIYTSGSTGQPKGVAVRHDAAVNTIVDINRKFKVGADDRLLGLSSMGFDLSVYDLFGALAAGAALVMVPDHRDMAAVLQTVETEGITVWNSVPALMELALDAAEPGRTFRSLRTALLSGDWIPLSLPDKLRSTFPQAEVVSLGGATEAAIWSIYYPVGEVQAGWSSIPYGRPLANQTWHVLSDAGRVCPVGVEGELYIGGRGLAEGYQGDPGKTAEAFISHPELGRLYRTGDYGVLRREGVIEFRGRKDQQVKLRGYRIELGEIQSRLSEHPAVRQAVVIDRNDGSGKKYLCAYIVQTAGNSADLTPDQTAELKQYLRDRLPEYMVPAFFIGIAAVPLTANGKVDLTALPEPAERSRTREEHVLPRSSIERIMAAIWEETLGVKPVSIHDNFYDLGGDSIKAIQIVARLQKHGLKLDTKSLFALPTIEDVSAFVRREVTMTPQGPVTGAVELTPVQRWFFAHIRTGRNHWNKSVMLYQRQGMDEAVVKSVFDALVQHHDALRIVFPASREGIAPVHLEPGVRGYTLDVFDYADDNCEQRILEEAVRLQSDMDLERGPLVRLGLFRTPAGERLLIAVHHLVIDGISLRILLEDFADGYRQAWNREPIVFQPKTASYQAWSQHLKEYAASRAYAADAGYWEGLQRTCADLLQSGEAAQLPVQRGGTDPIMANCSTETLVLGRQLTDRLLKEAHRAYSTRVNELLLTALGLAVREWTGKGKVIIEVEGHGRAELGEALDTTRTIGWFTSMYPVVLDIPYTEDLADAIIGVKETLRRVPNQGVGYGLRYYGSTGSEGTADSRSVIRPEIRFNYLGDFGQDWNQELFDLSFLPSEASMSPASERQHVLDLIGLVREGELQLMWMYNRHEIPSLLVTEWVNDYKRHLIRVMDHCTIQQTRVLTPADVGDEDLLFEELEYIRQLYSGTNT